MKLTTLRAGSCTYLAVVDVDAQAWFSPAQAAPNDPSYSSMQSLIDAGPTAWSELQSLWERYRGGSRFTHPLAEAQLLAPLPVPVQVRDFSVFPEHIKGGAAGIMKLAARARGEDTSAIRPLEAVPDIYKSQPIGYFTNRLSIIGPGATVTWPRYSSVMDYEMELAAIIGVGGKNISVEDARSHIFGFTVFNDFSARDAQMKEMPGMLGPLKGKSFDTGSALGPWIVTADEIPDPYALSMVLRVNGEVRTESSTRHMLHSFEEIIAYVSKDETLYPGEVLGSGTVNRGCGLEIDRFLADGDHVEIVAEGIGALGNTVRCQPA